MINAMQQPLPRMVEAAGSAESASLHQARHLLAALCELPVQQASEQADAVYAASRLLGLPPQAERIRWILMVTLPNSGSTAFARLLEASRKVTLLRGEKGGVGEGQWLLPDMCAPVARWRADHEIDFDRMRHVWVRTALARNPKCEIVFEKSPPNLVRIERLTAELGGPEKVRRIIFSREPLAICASWAKRHPPRKLAVEWLGCPPDEAPQGLAYFETLGAICGERFVLLADCAARAESHHVSYEALTRDPTAELTRLQKAFPDLDDVDAGAQVLVKDYAPQALKNMNETQIAPLSEAEVDAIRAGLAPHRAAISALGYGI